MVRNFWTRTDMMINIWDQVTMRGRTRQVEHALNPPGERVANRYTRAHQSLQRLRVVLRAEDGNWCQFLKRRADAVRPGQILREDVSLLD